MARGIIYHITTDQSECGNMAESSFYEDCDSLGIDYVHDASPEGAKEALEYFRQSLGKAGFLTAVTFDKEDAQLEPNVAFTIGPMEPDELLHAKEEYFRERWERLLKADLTLSEFACNSGKVRRFQRLLEDDFGDLALFQEDGLILTMTMDETIRSLSAHKTYYVADNAVIAH